MNRRGEKRIGGRVGEIAFLYQKKTREMIRISNSGEQIIVTYICKMDEKGYIYLGN